MLFRSVDIGIGHARTANNPVVYHRVLRMFLENQQKSGAGVTAALAAGDTDTALRILHTTRGVAGSIGALDLADTAQELETVIRTAGDAEAITTAGAGFAAALNRQLDALRTALDATAAPAPASSAPVGVDHARLGALKPALLSLQLQIRSANHEALLTHRALEASLRAAVPGERLDALGNALQRYDFDLAETLVAALIIA